MPEIEISDVPVASGSSEEIKEINSNDASPIRDDNSDDDPKSDEVEEWLDVLGSGDLKIKTLKPGEPNTRPQNFDICTIKFEATLEDGTVVEQNDCLRVEASGGEVIQGLDLLLTLLEVGQKVLAVIKARFAYGGIGLLPKIPKNATLLYTIELLKVEIPPELGIVPFDERTKRALFKKEKGNWWYSRGDANKAVQCYRAGLDSLQNSVPYVDDTGKVNEVPDSVFREMVQQRLVIYNNLTAAQLMINAYDSALISVENVIKLEPNNVKALFRKGKILFAKGNTDEAVETFSKVLSIEPDNPAAKKELQSALRRQSQEKIQAKSLYKKMLGTGTEKAQTKKRRDEPSGATSTLTKILAACASATVVAGVAYAIGSKYKGFLE